MVSQRKLQALYERFHDVDDTEEVINSDGIISLCEELGIDASCDIEILYFAWKCSATSCEQWTKQEFMNGMKRLGVDTLSDLRRAFSKIKEEELVELAIFRDFYRFVFAFSREGTKKTIEKDIAIPLLKMLKYNDESHSIIMSLCDYIENQTPPTFRITFDQWNNFLEFATTMTSSDTEDVVFANYDPDGAWPLLIDEFVEFKRK